MSKGPRVTFPGLSFALYPVPVRLGLFLVCLILLWLPLAIPSYLLLRGDPNLTSIVTMVALFALFLVLLQVWNRRFYGQRQPLASLGLTWSEQNGQEWIQGITIGLIFVGLLFSVEAALGWLRFNPIHSNLIKIVLEGSLTGLGVGFAEELFFRGWLLSELEQDYRPRLSLGVNAITFALLHFIKPLGEIMRTFPQFPALVLLGALLVVAKWGHQNRLGYSMGLHGGLVWGYYIFNVGKLFDYTAQVPTWVTGIDRNPLAGMMGILFLGILLLWVQKVAKYSPG